jgi:hypothetical protein
MKIYVAHEFELFDKKGKYETLNPKTFKEVVKVSELRELIGKQMAEDYCGKMSNTEVQHREKFRGELLAELSDSRQEKTASILDMTRKSNRTGKRVAYPACPKKKVTAK